MARNRALARARLAEPLGVQDDESPRVDKGTGTGPSVYVPKVSFVKTQKAVDALDRNASSSGSNVFKLPTPKNEPVLRPPAAPRRTLNEIKHRDDELLAALYVDSGRELEVLGTAVGRPRERVATAPPADDLLMQDAQRALVINAAKSIGLAAGPALLYILSRIG